MPEYWRVFPWDPEAVPGGPFSATHVPSPQGSGRFDLVSVRVLYLAEDPAHAVAERIARFRGEELRAYHLREFGRTLWLCSFTWPEGPTRPVLDLRDPGMLARHRIRPDEVAARDVTVSQAVALAVHAQGFHGLRWWSSFFGEWHGVVLFLDRVPVTEIQVGEPEPLTLEHPAVRAAALALGMRIATRS